MFSGFLEKIYIILCILKGEMPFKMHEIIIFPRKKYVCLPYLKFSARYMKPLLSLDEVGGIKFWRCLSVRTHFLSVRNHISIPIGQILFILGTNDKYHGLSISYKFGQNRPLNTDLSYCPCFGIGNYKAKPIFAFLCDDLHISSNLLYLTTSHYRP